MQIKINWLLLEYAFRSLVRRTSKSFFICLILSLLIFLLASVLMISDSIKLELNATLKTLPQITLQCFVAGKQSEVEIARVDTLLEIAGVEKVVPRIWGYYYFKPAGVNFSVVGIDAFEPMYKGRLEALSQGMDLYALQNEDAMIVGEGVKRVMEENYYKEFFNFITPQGVAKKVKIAGVFHSDLVLESNDMILLPKRLAYEIFGMDKSKATDIVVHVTNPVEIPTVVKKITDRFPDLRAITQDDIRVSYQNIFDYKSGLFLSLFSVCAFAFFIIIYDKTSGLSSEEKREIGILKALGWCMNDIIQEKFYESALISVSAFLVGVCTAIFFVYGLNAPLLRLIFIGYSELKPSFVLPFHLDGTLLVLLFFLSVPVYIAATVIPSWKAASLDADEVMR
jgi:ABC-type lipoprotein release transport system permease subunit